MRLIIIGASGFVGGAFYCLAKNLKIPVIGASTEGNGEFFPYNLKTDSPKDLSKVLSGEETHALIAAGITNINRCHREKALSEKINVTAIKELIDFFAKKI